MPREDPLRTEYRLLKVLTEGKLPVHVGFTEEQHKTAHPDVGIGYAAIWNRLKKLQADGTITGWVPILSERALARLKALETLFGEEDGLR